MAALLNAAISSLLDRRSAVSHGRTPQRSDFLAA
jgi:hypothetical protein